MVKIEERFLHLKSDIEELRINIEKSQVAHNVGLEYASLLDKLDLSNAKNIPILTQTTKSSLSKYLEYLRDRTELIRKVSPQTADRLTIQINRHEEFGQYLVKLFESVKTSKQLEKKTSTSEFQIHINELTVNVIRLDEAVNSCYILFLDFVDFLEK